MEAHKPKAIKNVGITIAIISGLVIFSNGMGALMFTLLGFNDYEIKEASKIDSIDNFFININYFLLVIVLIGVLFLIGSLNLIKYKLWAKNLISIVSIISIIVLWVLTIGVYLYFPNKEMIQEMLLPFVFMLLVLTSPLALLIWFLNKRNIKKHFE